MIPVSLTFPDRRGESVLITAPPPALWLEPDGKAFLHAILRRLSAHVLESLQLRYGDRYTHRLELICHAAAARSPRSFSSALLRPVTSSTPSASKTNLPSRST